MSQFDWLYEPDWSNGIAARFQLETDAVASLTKRENRRGLR